MADLKDMIKRQQVLADFGEFAISSQDLDEVLMEACRLVGQATGTGRAKIFEIQEDRQELFLRAGVGWAPDVVGKVRLPMDERSSKPTRSALANRSSRGILTRRTGSTSPHS